MSPNALLPNAKVLTAVYIFFEENLLNDVICHDGYIIFAAGKYKY